MNNNILPVLESNASLEAIYIKLKQIDELHNAVYDNYLIHKVDYDDESLENQMKVRELCVTHTTYTTLLEIAQDLLQEVKADAYDSYTEMCGFSYDICSGFDVVLV